MSCVVDGRMRVDTAVFGAGPVGCVAALAMARQGDRVALIEGNPHHTEHRLAGELLHPSGIRVLQDLGVDPMPLARDYPNGRGFVVFSENGGRRITLDYEAGQQGLSVDHASLVAFLRQAASSHARVEYLPHTRVLRIQNGSLISRREEQPLEIFAKRLIGATGRSPLISRHLNAERPRRLLSGMVGLLLEDVEMPCEGFGHIFLGGPGPLLLYRIGTRHVRLCCDFPLEVWKMRPDRATFLWEAYRGVLPPQLHDGFKRALHGSSMLYNANYCQPRIHYGWDEVALVGDATGYAHPLTATGITLGFGDVACLLKAPNLVQYRRHRLDTTCVPEMMANLLYEAFSGKDAFSGALRRAVFDFWQHPEACRSTVRLLVTEDTRLGRFCRLYLSILLAAVLHYLRSTAPRDNVFSRLKSVSATLRPWLLAPASSVLSRRSSMWRGRRKGLDRI